MLADLGQTSRLKSKEKQGYLARVLTMFFFSSRRRHTRSLRDWSSDVCSSDLGDVRDDGPRKGTGDRDPEHEEECCVQALQSAISVARAIFGSSETIASTPSAARRRISSCSFAVQIGRASCRERVWISMVDGAL